MNKNYKELRWLAPDNGLRARRRYGLETRYVYREIRNPLWGGSAFRVQAALDTRGLWAEISKVVSPGDDGDSMFVAGMSFGHDKSRVRNFSADGNPIGVSDVPKPRKLSLSLDFIKGLSNRYGVSVRRMDIVRAKPPVGFCEVRYGGVRDGERELLILPIRDEFGAAVFCDGEVIRCGQGSLWRLPDCRTLLVRPGTGLCVHAIFDVVPNK